MPLPLLHMAGLTYFSVLLLPDMTRSTQQGHANMLEHWMLMPRATTAQPLDAPFAWSGLRKVRNKPAAAIGVLQMGIGVSQRFAG
jgi:hypothetical protein